MAFNSFTYVFCFFPAVALIFALARKIGGARAGQGALLLGSLVAYAWPKPSNLWLLGGSIVVNWFLARRMAAETRESTRRRWLQLGLLLNIGFLCLFKYVNFFLSNLMLLGLPRVALPDWAFPLGISFFTLQQIMYLVDCYEGLISPSGLLDHATFVAFFPNVTSGPLARAKAMVPQLTAPKLTSDERWELGAQGLFLFATGIGKKVLLADSFARVADVGFAAGATDWSTVEAWVFSVAYTMQIYFDFSGYTDMALGSAAMLGIRLPRNFNAPFRARTVIEFWQRWHMSLSAFITTYLYTPILRAFSRATLVTAAVATLLSMTIAGLWHGPSWTFVVFGLLHGIALVVNQVRKKAKSKRLPKLPPLIATAVTFAFVNLTFIFFRSPDLTTAAHFAAQLLPRPGGLGVELLREVRKVGVTTLLPLLAFGLYAAFAGKTSDELAGALKRSTLASASAAALLLASFLYLNSNIAKQFVYFAF
ncbi:MAG TPA: MBOAT family O-acyltransferase [Polyangia bacterium]|nr:MBOAT family O-acyltransferase [Polyangia bacterium]